METEKQKLSQSLLLLKILGADDNIFGNLKLQKQVFLNEWNLIKSDLGGLYYKYFRYHLGPFSADLTSTFQWLANVGLVHKSTYKLTNRGEYLVNFLEGTTKHYRRNSKIFKTLDKTIDKYKPYTGQQLMNMVYRMVIEPEDMPGEKLKIKDIPAFTDILLPECRQLKYELEIPQHILKDIKAELDFDKDQQTRLHKRLPKLLKQSEKQLRAALDS